MLDEERLVPLAKNPLVPPLAERREDRPKRAAFFGEDVIETCPSLVIRPTLKHAGVDEPVETVRQDIASNAETPHEFVEAANAEERVAEDEQRPPLTYNVEGPGD
jgi:hypothetical protein